MSILDTLDDCVSKYLFPVLDDGFCYLANARLSIYSNTSIWALFIETLVADVRIGCYDGIRNRIRIIGNNIREKPGNCSLALTYPIEGSDEDFTEENAFSLRDKLLNISINGQPVQVHTSDIRLSIDLIRPEYVQPGDLLRFLAQKYPDTLFATDAELEALLSAPIPLILRLKEWQHPDIDNDELPSECESFQMIANVIVRADATCYKPTILPNTHWSNWPEGGTL